MTFPTLINRAAGVIAFTTFVGTPAAFYFGDFAAGITCAATFGLSVACCYAWNKPK